ncbi:MAG: glycine cleavage system aminomethyltransferase GcvT [Gammaproteobacteria bacterium]|nr:glycine cleavage system aminomethyltransferase GcvT [Gammaproteobacteria bacterium]MCY3688896.1 glycine cleavage system aminomethyltransferase GcvT [Gammaproteobacteria bacterium]MDE0480065.1 glycine cleavage system aminomethyltransferase GcvT [Gammaproteobacteria bacterium]
MGSRTCLFDRHAAAGAKIVDFSGWDMPLHYGSQIEEHNQVRNAAGVFDVSHMTVTDVAGADAENWLRYLLANDVTRLEAPGKALYSLLLNHDGGVVDDLIVYRTEAGYRLVTNCATRRKVLIWLAQNSQGFMVQVEERPNLAMMAVHGPNSIALAHEALGADSTPAVRQLGNFESFEQGGWLVARTGYTGELGLEVILPAERAGPLWDALLAAGVKPAGLGARDTLRLEAGMNLYGQDMDENTSPFSANLGWSVNLRDEERDFLGRKAVLQHRRLQQEGELPVLAGLVLEARGVLRSGQPVFTDKGEGVITSGSFSPTLKQSIALARIPWGSESCQVDLRGAMAPLKIVKPGFVRFGKRIFE